MLIALLALLGVDLIVIVALLVAVIGRRRWVVKQPGAFKGAIRTTRGEVDGISSNWRPGYGRWVREVLVWTKAPFFFRNELLASDGVEAERLADPGEIKRLGDAPVVLRLRVAGATAELAADGDEHDLLLGPYRKPTHQTPAHD